MFQRRNSHKLPPDLLSNFQKSFPRAGFTLFCETQDLPPSPERTFSEGAEPAMNFNPNFANQEDGTEHVSSPGNMGDWVASDPFNNQPNEFFSIFNDMGTPYQPTPASSSYGQHSHFFSGPTQPHDHQHQGIPTPQSASGLNSGPFFGHGHFMNPQVQQLQAMSRSFGQSYSSFYHNAPQPQIHMDISQNPAFITPDRLALPSGNTFEGTEDREQELTDQFRFCVTLTTATAMVKEGEIPVTYLNKCQPYKVTVKDTKPEQYAYGPVTYRTFIRVSFNEQQQRERAAHCWQLWKDGRGMSEAQQRGTKPFAVEYVPQNQSQHQGSNIMIQKEVFDGFCFHWTAPAGRAPECEIQLRCNFLSTDFSHSKGVKGIPVRLCAKTEVLPVNQVESSMAPEICFCKVKLFRDHGAERKLANDEAHVKKNIAKIEENMRQMQANQEETVLTSSGKRRQSDSYHLSGRPSKVARGKRASSVSSDSSTGLRETAEGDLQMKLAILNQNLRSKREHSLFFLKGEAEDDPDEYPVELPESSEPLSESPVDRNQSRRSTQLTTDSLGSPIATATSLTQSNRIRYASLAKQSTSDWKQQVKSEPDHELESSRSQHLTNQPPKAAKSEAPAKLHLDVFQKSIEVSDVDPSYVPPEQKPRAVACFYVRYSMNGELPSEPYYRAIYLKERSLAAFTEALALKRNLPPNKISEIILKRNLETTSSESGHVLIKVDDEVVSDVLEGQDMLVDISDDQNGLASSERGTKDIRYKVIIQFDEPPRTQK